MFERFVAAYPSDGGEVSPPANLEPLRQVPGLAELATLAAGRSFGNGVLCVFTDEEARRAQSLVNAMFPEWAVRIRPFAQDWLGRQYVLDLRRGGMLLLLEPGSGGVYELEEKIPELFDQLMVDDPAPSSAWICSGRGARCIRRPHRQVVAWASKRRCSSAVMARWTTSRSLMRRSTGRSTDSCGPRSRICHRARRSTASRSAERSTQRAEDGSLESSARTSVVRESE